jgi:hypothetical protein
MHTAMAENTEQDVTVQMHRQDKEALEFDVTQCRFAEFFGARRTRIGRTAGLRDRLRYSCDWWERGRLPPRSDDHAGRTKLHVPIQICASMNPPAITSGVMISPAEQTSRSHR